VSHPFVPEHFFSRKLASSTDDKRLPTGACDRRFIRVCLRETGLNPGLFVDRMRVEAAPQIIDSSSRGLKDVGDSCGFKSADAMRRTFVRVLGATAAKYASRFKSSIALAPGLPRTMS
jgi:transcriptional regulator GlxA family with amidase domain